jgi:flagellar M-ring protein FliF
MAEIAEQGNNLKQNRVRESMERFRDLPTNKKSLLYVGIAAVAALVIGTALWMREPTWKVLFSNVSDKDGGQITTALQQMNVPYELSSGGTIAVPAEKVYETRLKLATQGLPKASGVGFELMDNQKFGISQFAEQVNYQRSIEGELARTIQALSAVESARVHLAIPKNSVFLREQQKPTASVVLNLNSGRLIDPTQIHGIMNLVASAVPGLPPRNITIVDQEGNMLSTMGELNQQNQNGLDQRQLNYVKEIEQTYIKRIETILEPIFGKGNARAEVTAELDFSQREQTSENYTPNSPPNAAAIRSQQMHESTEREPLGPGGVPGALSNQPPNAAAAPITLPAGTQAGVSTTGQATPDKSTKKDSTVNYEVDRTIQHVKMPVGMIKRVSAAVVVNYKKKVDNNGESKFVPLTQQELGQINNLVCEAMGYNPARGDTLNVVNAAFADNTARPALEQRAIDFITENIFDIAKWGLLLLVLLYLIFGIIRPIVREVINPPVPEEEYPDGPAIEGGEGEGEEGDEVVDEVEMQRREYAANLEAAREIIRNDPRMAAQIIKEWISDE